MKKTASLILFFFITFISYSQIDRYNGIEVSFEFNIGEFKRVILKKNKENKFKGRIINHIEMYEPQKKIISDKYRIKKTLVKKLFKILDSLKIESMKKMTMWECGKLYYPKDVIIRDSMATYEKYCKCIEENEWFCLDGDSSTFKIKIGEIEKTFRFDCLHFNEEITNEKPESRIQAINIINILNRELELIRLYNIFIKALRPGKYSGYGTNIMVKR
jgi:hypothetical protein